MKGEKMKLETINDIEIIKLYDDIKELVEQSKNRVYKTVNVEMIDLYAFASTNIESMEFINNVYFLGIYVFNGASNLKSVFIQIYARR